VLCLLLLVWILKLPGMNLRVPLYYASGGDLLTVSAAAKRMAEGSMFYFPNLGAPYGANWNDIPGDDLLHDFLLKLVTLVTPNFGAAINVFFCLTFLLTMLTAVWVLRHFGISWAAALVAATLFAFLPYHFFRADFHLMLSAYYMVPPIIAVILWIAESRPLVGFSRAFGRIPFRVERPYGVAAIVIALLAGSAGIYYTFFALFLLAVAGVIAAADQRGWRPLAQAMVICAVMIGAVWINTLPYRIYVHMHGPNPEAIRRGFMGTEVYSLRITQLVLPVTHHRWHFLAGAKARYNAMMGSPWINENDSASLGFIGAAGFLLLIVALFWRSRARRLGILALLNVSAVLLATASGFCMILALLGLYDLRGYNRISVFIAFFSLFALGIVLTALARRLGRYRWGAPAFWALAAGLIAFGLWDQTGMTVGYGAQHRIDQNAFAMDDEFVHRIEASVPTNAMIFQLPYMPFPEAGPMRRMVDYDPLRGYLHSRTLRWSYGAVRGRPADEWCGHTAALPPVEMARKLALGGFAGIYIDRFGYADNAVALERQLAAVAGAPMVRVDGRISFFNLASLRSHLTAGYTPQQVAQLQKQVVGRPVVEMHWGNGCYPLEGDSKRNWRWCGQNGELDFVNRSSQQQKLYVGMLLADSAPAVATMSISGPHFQRSLQTSQQPAPFSTTLDIPVGNSALRFSTTAKPVLVPGDDRTLVFQVENFQSHPER
jgi:hypothetical protein